MSKLEQWVKIILGEDADGVSIETVRNLQTIKHKIDELEKENEWLREEDKRLHGIAEFWQNEYNKLNPGFQIPKIDNL